MILQYAILRPKLKKFHFQYFKYDNSNVHLSIIIKTLKVPKHDLF